MEIRTATMTVPEAAVRLGIGKSLAYELARRGELPGAIRLGRSLRVSTAALDAALAPNLPSRHSDGIGSRPDGGL